MAKIHRFDRLTAGFTCALIVLAILTSGCQQSRPAIADAPLAPNFGGHTLLKPPAPAPSPVAVVPAPLPVKPVPRAAEAVPPGTTREWIPYAAANNWKWIVIHHSATSVGGAVRFDKEHREVRHFDELGYHFVIGNGTDTPDGKVEVGSRWPKQKWGAHAQTPDEQYNRFGIGICLVGNFDLTNPSDAQMRATARLVAYLMHTYNIPQSHVIGHGQTKSTDCPGRNMHLAMLKRMTQQILAVAGPGAIPPEAPVRTASATGELMFASPTR